LIIVKKRVPIAFLFKAPPPLAFELRKRSIRESPAGYRSRTRLELRVPHHWLRGPFRLHSVGWGRYCPKDHGTCISQPSGDGPRPDRHPGIGRFALPRPGLPAGQALIGTSVPAAWGVRLSRRGSVWRTLPVWRPDSRCRKLRQSDLMISKNIRKSDPRGWHGPCGAATSARPRAITLECQP
jgi:hypothetical protein